MLRSHLVTRRRSFSSPRGARLSHALAVEPLERRLLLAITVDYSTLLPGISAGEDAAIDKDGYLYMADLGDDTVRKLDPSGRDASCNQGASGIECWSKALTLSSSRRVGGIVVDGEYVYLTGVTRDSFDGIIGEAIAQGATPIQSTFEHPQEWGDAFVAVLDKDTGGVHYATYLGGKEGEIGLGIAVDDVGAIYVSGWATSGRGDNFPVPPDPSDLVSPRSGGSEVFLAKLVPAPDDPKRYDWDYLDFIGGDGRDQSRDLVLVDCETDLEGRKHDCEVLLLGFSTSGHFNDDPEMLGEKPFVGRTDNQAFDGFLVRVTQDGTLLGGTFFGGDYKDTTFALVVDPEDPTQVYVAGDLGVGEGEADAFLAVIDVSDDFTYVLYDLGGEGDDKPKDIAVDDTGVYLVGFTQSRDFPTKNPIEFDVQCGTDTRSYDGSSLQGVEDGFVVRYSKSDISTPTHSTYLGGRGYEDKVWSVVLSAFGDVYVVGTTSSTNFPITCDGHAQFGVDDGAWRTDPFVARISFPEPPLPGDANGDGRFDQLDLVAVLQADKYMTGQAADWSQGDWNGDGLFNLIDIVVSLQTGKYLADDAFAQL